MGEVELLANNEVQWRAMVEALCLTRDHDILSVHSLSLS